MVDVLQLPDEIICCNGFHVDGSEALCIMLKRFAYPCRYLDLLPRFAKPVPQSCMASNHVMNLIYTQWNHLLTDLDQPWLSPANLQQFSEMIHRQGGTLQNCWGFVDGTLRPVSRPGRNQRVLYNGHKKFIPLNFSQLCPQTGLLQICRLYGPVEGMNKRQHNIRSVSSSPRPRLLRCVKQKAHNSHALAGQNTDSIFKIG